MTPKIQLDLSDALWCKKKGCRRPGPYHRHHRRHKKYWVNKFEGRRIYGYRFVPQEEWEAFVRALEERYARWLDRDIVVLCDYHHVEIHAIYSRINRAHLERCRGGRVTIRVAVKAMRECKAALREWLKSASSGMNPKKAGWT